MKEFYEWLKDRSRLECGGLFKSIEQCELEAFKAGMLAAADIAEDGYPESLFGNSPYAGGRRDAAENIRDKANGIY